MGMRLGRNRSRHRASLAATALAVLVPAMGPDAAADALRDGLLECATKADDSARLRCFDATVADLRKGDAPTPTAAAGAAAAPGTAAAGAAVATGGASAGAAADTGTPAGSAAEAGPATAPDAPSPSLSPEDRFGLRGDLKREKHGDLTELAATAASISTKPRGERVITLDNGQVWAEIAPGSTIRLKPGDPVRIQAGTLGSFILIAPNGRSSKVSRIR